MRLKKYFKRTHWTMRGQTTVEYFILLVALALLTIVGSSTFFAKVKRSSDYVFNFSTTQMKQDLGGFAIGGAVPGGWENQTI